MAVADQIAALEAALERGVLKVSEAGRTIEYSSPQAIIDAIGRLKSQQALAAGTKRIGFMQCNLGDAR